MSNSQNPDTQRAATRSLQGKRLFDAGDCNGAIAACTEAIELNSGSIRAYRTRAVAYKCLGREEEAEADLEHLANRFAAQKDWDGLKEVRLTKGRKYIQLAGTVTGMRADVPYYLDVNSGEKIYSSESNPLERMLIGKDKYYITVSSTKFEISSDLYNGNIRIGDKVVLTLVQDTPFNELISRYVKRKWATKRVASTDANVITPQSTGVGEWAKGEVISILRGTSVTAHQLSAPEEDLMEPEVGILQELCTDISDLGVDARVLEQDPFRLDKSGTWIEIAEGPIRWIELVPDPRLEGFSGYNCLVPDSRIGSDFPHAGIRLC